MRGRACLRATLHGLSTAAILEAASAHALSPQSPVSLMPMDLVIGRHPGPLRLEIADPLVTELDVESAVIGEAGQVASPPRNTGMSINLPDAQPPLTIPGLGSIVTSPLPRSVSLPELHSADLAPGLYAERIFVTVLAAGGLPQDLTFIRHFEVTNLGMRPLSPEEYSARTERTASGPEGRVYVGTQRAGLAQPELSGQAVMVRSADSAANEQLLRRANER